MTKKKKEILEEIQEGKKKLGEFCAERAKEIRDTVVEPGIAKVDRVVTTNKLEIPEEKTSQGTAILAGHISTKELPMEGDKINLSDRDFCLRYGQDADFEGLRKIIEQRPRPSMFSFWVCPRCKARVKLQGKFSGQKDINCFSCNPRNFEGFPFLQELTKQKEIEAFEKAEKAKFARQLAGMKKSAQTAKSIFEHEVGLGKFR